MSLSPATKEISAHPGKNTVVAPVNSRQKEQDVERKLALYAAVSAFRQGRMPSNSQVDAFLSSLEDVNHDKERKLSAEGKRLLNDARDILETARVMVKEKNADELLQDFVWHTRDVDASAAKQDPSALKPVDGEKARADGQSALRHLRTLLSLVLTNAEARKLVSDFGLIGRDLLARGVVKAAETIRPDPETMAHVDESAPQDRFIRQGSNFTGTGGAAKAAKQRRSEVKAQTEDEANAVARDVENGGDSKQTIKDRLRGYRDNVSSRVPEEHKDRAKQFLTEEYFPEERRDQFIFRLKKVVIECQKHQEYQTSLRWFFDFIEEYTAHGKVIANAGKDGHEKLMADPALTSAMGELRTLLERFANGTSTTMISDAVQHLVADARSDAELRTWFTRVDAYVRKVLFKPGFVIEPACNAEASKLQENGRQFYDGKYKAHFDALFRSVGDFFKAMGDDPLNQRFGQDWARLTKDLLFDNEGSLKFKPELWRDIRTVVVPALVDKVGYVPIPRVEYTDDQFDVVIENLALSGRNLLPNIISMEAHNFFKFSPYEVIGDQTHHEFTLTLGQIQADMRDVAFWFRKKSGLPKMTDSGLADVLLGGEGLTIAVHLVSADHDPSSVFKVKSVNVKVDTLKFAIRDSKHNLLYNTLRPLAAGIIKRQLQKAIADALTTGLEYVDGQLIGVRDRLKEAKASDDGSRGEVLKQAFHSKKDPAKTEANTKTAKFNVVSKRDSLLLPGFGSPAGWINRASEKEEKAATGNGWRSDAFGGAA